jgi:uncharacterized protein YabE (DUF348 family)
MLKKRSTFLVVLASLLLVLFLVLFAFRQKVVTLSVDGRQQSLTTRAWTVGLALKSAGVTFTNSDHLQPPAGRWVTNGMVLVVQHASRITIWVGSESTGVTSAASAPYDWLQIAGISLGSRDRLFVDGLETADPAKPLAYAPMHQVEIRRPVLIELRQDGHKRTFLSTARTVGEALSEAGILLSPSDRLDPPADTPLDAPLTVTLLSSRPITVRVGKNSVQVRASADTVAAALAQTGLSLQGLDYSLPADTEPVPANGEIQVVRVSEIINQETEIIPFETVYEAQAEMEIGTQKIIQFGRNGSLARRTTIRYENGKEISRIEAAEQVIQEPVSQIEGFGARVSVQSMDTPEGPLEYYRALDFYATSYHPRMTSPPWYGSVACGGKWQPGYVAVDLNYIPCGTRLYVPGYGIAIAMDTGSFSGAWIDLGFPDDNYVAWHRHVTVYFLTPVPPVNQMNWVIPPGSLY